MTALAETCEVAADRDHSRATTIIATETNRLEASLIVWGSALRVVACVVVQQIIEDHQTMALNNSNADDLAQEAAFA